MFKEFPEAWQKILNNQNMQMATTIQKDSYSVLQNKENALLISPTGTGKTLAYIWPLLPKLRSGIRNQLVIVAPSQELALQITKVVREWAKALDFSVIQLIGGANINRQIDKLKKHPEIVVGTPGRLVELMNRRKVRADYVETIVFDEIDALFTNKAELNFANQLLKKVQRDTQFIGVTATFAEPILQFLPANIQIIDASKTDNSKGEITEYYLETPLRKRVEILRKLAYTPDFHAMVFFNTVQELGVVADKLSFEGIPISTLASDESKFERQMSLKAFKNKQSALLLTTDISSRGLDLENLTTVVNYDVPVNRESYIHRSGRVGRMKQAGRVINLVNGHELKALRKLISKDQQLQQIYVHHGELTTESNQKKNTN